MIAIRRRCDDDLNACVAVLHIVQENEGYPRGTNDFRKFLANERVQDAWIAELHGGIIGHVAINKASDTDLSVSMWKRKYPKDRSEVAVLARLFVLPECRKSGAAKALVEAATASSNEDGVRLVLFVLLANQAAMRLYERLGWERYGTDVFKFGDNKEQSMEAICFASPAPS